ncbi:hypothetical protein B0A50_00895 [Salinomyces thailandicus]|uniref:SMODS and SLOG-associating 2TM effector domain-containing protein n=1 Tax=Salinomyces thailandicus TaxID=706561 RepID=A0A4U0UEQ7_9PEZI|nr:hypothetical protein B0A50_00895 [Salinomyces thailandica]
MPESIANAFLPSAKLASTPKGPSPGISESHLASAPLQIGNAIGYGTLESTRSTEPHDMQTVKSTEPLLADAASVQESDRQTTFDDTAPMTPVAFRRLIGLRSHADAGASPAEIEAGHGLYHDIRVSYESARRAHLWFEIGVYTALLTQVLLSANFIIIGAMQGDHHVPIAILGAVSVGIAGCLALVKGQGLPMRLRMVSYEDTREGVLSQQLMESRSVTPCGKYS